MSVLIEPMIQKTPGVMGGEACIRRTRISVWLLVEARRLGLTDQQLLDDYPDSLSQRDLDAAWRYAAENPAEIERALIRNDAA